MRTWLIHWWDTFRTSYWFVPSLLILLGIVLALLMPRVDAQIGDDVEQHLEIIVSTAPAARLSLSSIAGALITITGVVFSITLVALTSTASQFGSRLIRNMMDDRMTQVALGVLMGTSVYCLLVVRVVYDSEEVTFVPHLSVALGFVLTVASVVLFVAFIHHVGKRLQAPNLVHSVAMELDQAIDRLYPESIGTRGEGPLPMDVQECLDELGPSYTEVTAGYCGYLQGIDGNGLMHLACKKDLVLHVPSRPGSFIVDAGVLAKVWPKERVDSETIDAIRDCFVIGRSRSPRQDVGCSLNELVEIAVRALSAGINDPFTAMTCLDYLGSALARFATRKLPSPVREDDDGQMRILTSAETFGLILDSAFSLILHHARSNPVVVLRLLQTIEGFHLEVRDSERREDVRELLQRIRTSCEAEFPPGHDRRMLLEKCEQLIMSLNQD